MHRVRMVLDTVALTYRFVPADLVIRRGDVVEFVNESGGPHNVAFERDEFTPEAAAALDRAMPDHAGAMEKMGLLVGPLITREGLMYDVSFAAVAPGTYHFHCTPHEALGMTGTITVQ